MTGEARENSKVAMEVWAQAVILLPTIDYIVQ